MTTEGAPDLRLVSPGEGWEAAYRDNVVPVYRFIASRTGNRPDAEDLTSAVFLRALPLLRRDASAGEVRAYLMTTARTVLADHWARRYGDRAAMLLDEHPAPVPAAPDDGEAGRRAADILERLPERERRVLELRFLRGASVRETAHELGVSVANAKVIQWRALRRAAGLEPA